MDNSYIFIGILCAFDQRAFLQQVHHFLARHGDAVMTLAAVKSHSVCPTLLPICHFGDFVQRVTTVFFEEELLVGESGRITCEKSTVFCCEETFAWVGDGPH